MTVFIDGATDNERLNAARRLAHGRGYDTAAKQALIDHALYHVEPYASTVGMEYEGQLICVGCWWCDGPRTQAHEDGGFRHERT